MPNKNRTVFRDVVARLEDRSLRAIAGKARVANRLAKASERQARRNAYAAKARALRGLAERFPDQVRVARDPMLPKFVLVTVESLRLGLHAPASMFGVAAD